MNEQKSVAGPLVVARRYVNESGHVAFHFTPRPFVHPHVHSAEQEARRLVRDHNSDFSVFRHWATVSPVLDEPTVVSINADRLAGALAQALQEADRHLSIDSARYLVDRALNKIT